MCAANGADGAFSGSWALVRESMMADYDAAIARAQVGIGPDGSAGAAS